jgi:hypothetical protein
MAENIIELPPSASAEESATTKAASAKRPALIALVTLLALAFCVGLFLISRAIFGTDQPDPDDTAAALMTVETVAPQPEQEPPTPTKTPVPLPTVTPLPMTTETPMPTTTPLPTETPIPEPIIILIEAPVLIPFGPPVPVQWSITIEDSDIADFVSIQIVNSGHIMRKSEVTTNEVISKKTVRGGETWLIEAYIDPATGDGALELAVTARGDVRLIKLPFTIADTPAVTYESFSK